MTVYEDEPEKPPQRETVLRSIDWRTIGVWAMLGAIGALLVLAFSGCSPLAGPAGARIGPAPEQGLGAIPPALAATEGELATVDKAAKTVKQAVSDMVKPVREAAKAAPAPAAAIAAGHETIYAAASTAEAAALEAQVQVRNASASTAQVNAELKGLREAHQREVEALGQQVADYKQEVNRLKQESANFLQTLFKWGMILGGLAIAAGAGLFFAKMGVAIPMSVIGFGATLLALSALLDRIAGWIVPVAGGLAGLGVVAAVVYGISHWQAVSKAGIAHADNIKAGVRDAVKTDGVAAIHVAEALKAVKESAEKNQSESVQRTIWELRPF